jgi:hypothetical protein
MAPMAMMAETVVTVSNGEQVNGYHECNPMQVDSGNEFCTSVSGDPLNWAKTARAMEGSHLEEVKRFVETFYGVKEVSLEGVSLTIAHVAAVARRQGASRRVLRLGAEQDHARLGHLRRHHGLRRHLAPQNATRSRAPKRTHQVINWLSHS